MIRLKSIRLKGNNSAALACPGSTSATDKDAEMYFFPRDEYVAAKRRRGGEEYIIPTSDIAYMQPLEPLDCFEKVATLVTTVPGYNAVLTMPPEPIDPELKKLAEYAASDDVVRMVKIDGKIVERRGPPKDDELEALTAPKRSIFEPEDDEEPTDDSQQ